jgi:hypothetical protein
MGGRIPCFGDDKVLCSVWLEGIIVFVLFACSKFVLFSICIKVGTRDKEELVMSWVTKTWNSWFKKELEEERSEKRNLYTEVLRARARWEEAIMYFEEASGVEEVDYAIYMLEAAEIKYQMYLKQAKKIGLDRSQIYVEDSAV